MTFAVIAGIAILVWVLAGIVTVKLAIRAGLSWGFFPGDGWTCRAWVILQAPGALLDTLFSDAVWWLADGEEPLTPTHAHVLWTLLVNPALIPHEAPQKREGGAA